MVVTLKSAGYVVSIISVILLGMTAWKTASQDDVLRLCLIGGMLASIAGMLLRWISHLKDQQEKGKQAQNG